MKHIYNIVVISRILWRSLLLASISLIAISSGQPTFAAGEIERYFPETGHWVSGEFLEYFQRVPFPDTIYGFPITDAFIHPQTGRRTQYFQRALFEFHPENPPGQRVQLSPLGEWVYQPGEPIEIPPNNPACQLFGNNPIPVCFSFLDYYLEFGGTDNFGEPISGLENNDGRITQYFEYARIEWHPENTLAARITLGNLGEGYFDQSGENDSLRVIMKDNRPFTLVLELKIRAFLETAVTFAGDSQTIFVTVHDQNLEPVPQAQVTYVVKYPSGEKESNILLPTNELGFTQQTFAVKASDSGMVEIYISVIYRVFSETTRTSFRIWLP